jgi:hypothetical protein
MHSGSFKAGSSIAGSVTFSSLATVTKPVSRFKTRVLIKHKSGGLKLDTWIEQENNTIQSIDFEINQRGMGAGSIVFTSLDFPIDADDTIEIYYDGTILYQGIIDTTPDPKGGKCKITPRSTRLAELLINDSYSADTIEDILEDIITTLKPDSGIVWNASFIDIDNTDTFSPEWIYETAKKAIESLVNKLDDHVYGVNEYNIFFVKQASTTVDALLLQNGAPVFSSVEVKTEHSKIKSTRYQVLQKAGTSSSETTRAGEVGYGGSYPTPAIETLTRKKESKLTVSEVLSGTEALQFAFAQLTAETVVPRTISVKGIDISRYIPKVLDLVQIEDRTEEQLFTIETCDSLDNWSSINTSIDTSDYVEGTGSVLYTVGSSYPQDLIFDFGSIYRVFKVTKIGFMIKSSVANTDDIFFSIGYAIDGADGLLDDGAGDDGIGTTDGDTDLFTNLDSVPVSNGNQWFYMQYDLTADFKQLGWQFNSGLPAGTEIHIDRIQLFGEHREIYEANINKINYKIDSNGINVDMTLDQLDLQANDAFFQEQLKVEKIETITKGA